MSQTLCTIIDSSPKWFESTENTRTFVWQVAWQSKCCLVRKILEAMDVLWSTSCWLKYQWLNKGFLVVTTFANPLQETLHLRWIRWRSGGKDRRFWSMPCSPDHPWKNDMYTFTYRFNLTPDIDYSMESVYPIPHPIQLDPRSCFGHSSSPMDSIPRLYRGGPTWSATPSSPRPPRRERRGPFWEDMARVFWQKSFAVSWVWKKEKIDREEGRVTHIDIIYDVFVVHVPFFLKERSRDITYAVYI